DFPDTPKGNDILPGIPEPAAQEPSPGHDHRFDAACAFVKYQVCHVAQLPAVAGIDHFLLLKITEPHAVTSPFILCRRKEVRDGTRPFPLSLSVLFYSAMTFSLLKALAMSTVRMPPSARVSTRVTRYWDMVRS